MITAAPIEDTRWLLADWMEFEALCSTASTASVHSINTDPVVEPDVEPDALDEDGLRHDNRIARLTREIETRQRFLGDAYPFAMSADGARLERGPHTGVGATVYLFCLLASHGRKDGFLVDSDILPIAEVPDLFQACATWSAAGYEEGPAYALGLEPGSDTFLPKLGTIFRAFGDGICRTAIPPGAPPAVKDDGIDVVAWKSMADQKPPASYLLGQVASGRNWLGKSVKANVERFLNTWFVPPPARTARPAMMMPFCIEPAFDEDESIEQEALEMHWRRLIGQFGEVFYRYRLPCYAARGLQLHTQGTHVDMADWRPQVESFVHRVIENLQARCR